MRKQTVIKREIPIVENERARLRLLERADLPLTLQWRNQDEIRRWFLNTSILSEEAHGAWFERYEQLDNDFVFLILIKELHHQPVGQISLYNIDWESGKAEFGRLMIGEPIGKGKGYAKQATTLLLHLAFDFLYLREVFLEVKVANEPAIAVYKSAGFTIFKSSHDLISMQLRSV